MDFIPRLQQTQLGQPGFGAVQNLGSQMPLPPEIQKNIANMRMLMNGQNMNPQSALKQMEPGFSGMTPEALTALEALMSRNAGPSNYPGADSRLRQAVDVAYNPK